MRNRRWLAALGAAIAVLAGVGTGEARAQGTRVGLVVATHVNMSETDADMLATSMAEALRSRLQVDVIAGAEVRRRLPPDGVPADCIARVECLRDVATRLDGDELLFLFLVKIGPRVQVDSTWADPTKGSVVSRAALVVNDTPQDKATVLAGAAPRLLPHAQARAQTEWEADAVGASPSIEADREIRRGRHFTVPSIVAGAVGVVALGAGAGFGIAARLDYSALEDDGCARMDCPGEAGRIDKMESRALAADILLAAGGAALVTSAILYITSGESEPMVRVEGGAGGGIVSFGGRF
jgi:hypothetical protein